MHLPVVSVCALTYLRPDGLRRLLQGVAALTFTGGPPPVVEVVIVDNDPEGSGRAVCDELRAGYPWDLTYVVESNRGIPQARNRAIDAARADADFIAFIDDDEVPDPDWLDGLLRAQARHGADMVSGPTRPHFPTEPAAWIRDGGFFERERHAEGHPLDYCATANLLVRAGLFDQFRFDERMSLTGGSDTMLTYQATTAGKTLIFTNDAEVTEWYPDSRVTAGWILRRSYRLGNSFAVVESLARPSRLQRPTRAAKGVAHAATGIARTVLSLGRKPAAVHALREVGLGLGMVAGVLGRRYEEYREVHAV